MPPINFMNETIQKIRSKALAVGVLGTGATVAGYFIAGPEQFFQSWLIAFLYVLAFAVGGLGFLMIHHLVAGRWSFVLQRPYEAAARTFPLILILFIPLLFGMEYLYSWVNPEAHHNHLLVELVHAKSMYLNVPDFQLRAVIYFAVWIGLTLLLTRWSRKQDASHGLVEAEAYGRKMRMLSGIGLVIFGLASTFAAFDWVMSVEPMWYSAIYGALIMMGQGLSLLCLLAIVAYKLSADKEYGAAIGSQQYHDIGNMMFAFLILLTYMAVGEYIILWSGNLPEEVEHYILRDHAPWTQLALAMAVLHFAIPFALMLLKENKRNPKRLVKIAFFLLLMRGADYFWLVMPVLRQQNPHLHWMDVVAPIGLFGIWFYVFLGSLKSRPLLPQHEPRFSHALEHPAGKGSH